MSADAGRSARHPAPARSGCGERPAYHAELTYLAGFRASVERHPDAAALTDPGAGRSWSYGELDHLTDRVAAALRSAGLERGEAVMCSMPNRTEFVFLWLGTQKAGGVFAPINPRLAPGEVALHLADSRPRVFAFDRALRDIALEGAARSGHAPPVLVVAGGSDAPAATPGRDGELLSWEALLDRGGDGSPAEPPAGPDDEVVRLYRLGPGGEALGVPITNVNSLARAHDVIMHLPLEPGGRTLNLTPWFHAGGLQVAGPSPSLLAGCEVVALPGFDGDGILDLIESRKIACVVGVPFTFELLARVQERRPRNLGSLRAIVSMGQRLEPSACARLREVLGPRLYNGYGTTETFWNTLLRPRHVDAHAGTAGRACTGDHVRVVRRGEGPGWTADPEDLVPRDGVTEGEIVIRSAKSSWRYHGRPDMTRRCWVDGWFLTGDVGTWDRDGFIDVVGRWDDMIISAGENIHPSQVRALLLEHPGIIDALVVGVPDALRGQTVAAYLVRTPDGPELGELKRWLADHPDLARFKRPRLFRFVDRLPAAPEDATGARWLRRRATGEAARGLFTR